MELKDKIDRINVQAGKPFPIGVWADKNGVNFSVETKKKGKLSLVIYKKNTNEILRTIDFSENMRFGKVYAMYVPGFDKRHCDYGYMLDGKLIKDEYGKLLNRNHQFGTKPDKYIYSVYYDTFDWENDVKPSYDFSDTIIYRLHTRGFTMHKSSKVRNKGTFAGIIEKIPYLKELGITTLELMPAYEFDEVIGKTHDKNTELNNRETVYHRSLNTKEKTNFFGYGNAHYFAPKGAYSVKGPATAISEFKTLVKELHKNKMELIMEFYFVKDTLPQLINDCIRYWVMEYHIDGIKVNLDMADVKYLKSDPLLNDIKIIGDRWDIISEAKEYDPAFGEQRHIAVCHEGFMVAARRFIKSDENQVYEMSARMSDNDNAGSIINYLANHNSFTLYDTVSYERKHNEANGEGNNDGAEYNYSWNCGVEGATKKKKIVDLRKKQMKNAIALLFLSQGTPMIFSGDEMAQTRNGNNNPYCQDNELSYINWSKTRIGTEIYDFVAEMISYRKSHKILHMSSKLKLMDYKSVGCPDLSLHGTLPWRIDYHHVNRTFALLYDEKYARGTGKIYIACNMYWENQEFNIPLGDKKSVWKVDITTSKDSEEQLVNNRTIVVPPRSIVVLSLK